MALNGASYNVPGEATGPTTEAPPQLAADIKSEVLKAASEQHVGQSAPGKDGGDKEEGKKVKSEKELKKEAAKAEKLKKFNEKKQKTQQAAPAAKEKVKKPKAEVEELPEYEEETPEGAKKILKSLDDPHRKAYIPGVVESAWGLWWEKEGFFKPEFTNGDEGDVKENGYFVIPIPPPNVTGNLHIGHALATALQDALIRWNRMLGKTVLYLPGCDHAGISTQSVVENMLWRREGKTRHDLGREKLVETIWAWKGDYHKRINNVLRRMGGSLDWTREAFTMDANLSAAVTETFCRLQEEGLIYRDNRLVNWCCRLQTAMSNLEVDNKELTGRTLIDVPGYDKKVAFGVITTFKYPIDGSDDTISVATTRLETMLADTAIAVHPEDERYAHLVGKFARHPIIDRLIPIVADTYVEKDFGTGAVKITPGHDANDFALGKRHDLERINLYNDDGTINENGGSFKGQKRFDARHTVAAELKKLGLYVEEKDNPMFLPLCSRTKDVIEPILRPQWWMDVSEMAKESLAAVEDGRIKIRPKTAHDNYARWMKNIEPWCLSRQLWWGHQCPAYLLTVDGQVADDEWVVGRTLDEAQKKADAKYPGKKVTLQRDPDVLDTWFSSGLWPFSTLGWPKVTHDFEKLFPTSLLETGWDILFFWVARMIMLSLKLTGQVPFTEVYCHSLVRDSDGRKMSKSLGNVIDPVDIMDGISLSQLQEKLLAGNLDPKEVTKATAYQKTAFPQGIPECGSDALRFSLIQYTTGGGDIAFDVKVMAGYRRFMNKIYQATKYCLGTFEKHGDGFKPRETALKSGKETLSERWILSKMNRAAKSVNDAMSAREFSRATQILYNHLYDELFDVFIENSKTIIIEGTTEERNSAMNTLYTVLEQDLRLLHPFAPFLTEELWQRLGRRPSDATRSITVAQYPVYKADFGDSASEEAYELVLGLAKGVRTLISEYRVENAVVYIQTANESAYSIASEQLAIIKSISGKNLKDISIIPHTEATPTSCAVFAVSTNAAVYLKLQGDINVDEEIAKIQVKMKKAAETVAKQKKVISAPDFKEKVSVAVQEAEDKKLEEALALRGNYEKTIQQFQTMKR